MGVDVDALIELTTTRQIPLEKMISAIENSVTEAYRELPEAKPQGRAGLNRDTGDISIHVPIFDDEGIYKETIVDEPEGFDEFRHRSKSRPKHISTANGSNVLSSK